MQCVINLTFQFFFIYLRIWVCVTIEEFTGHEWLSKGKQEVETVSKDYRDFAQFCEQANKKKEFAFSHAAVEIKGLEAAFEDSNVTISEYTMKLLTFPQRSVPPTQSCIMPLLCVKRSMRTSMSSSRYSSLFVFLLNCAWLRSQGEERRRTRWAIAACSPCVAPFPRGGTL